MRQSTLSGGPRCHMHPGGEAALVRRAARGRLAISFPLQSVQAGEAASAAKGIIAAGPVLLDRMDSGSTHNAAQHRCDDDCVVGAAQHGDEVGNQIER
jgi:hypothetical protein